MRAYSSQELLGSASQLGSIIKHHRPNLEVYEDFYRNIHQNPEISGLEKHTASVVGVHLQRLGFEVHANIGFHGVAGTLHNGPGKTILIRAELDALPIREETGLPYKSTKVMADRYGRDRPVMHACGHDMNMAALLAASALLYSARDEWSGTIIVVFQPDEEETGGARAMVNGGLYSKVPVPDIMLGQHVVPLPAGKIAIRSGPILMAADTMKVRIIGGPCSHSPNPQNCVDPVPVAMRIVMQLQDVVIKELGFDSSATVACWGIHAGYPGNDYVDHVDFLLDIKTLNLDIRAKVLAIVENFIKTECRQSGTPQDPVINTTVRAPLTTNDPSIVVPIEAAFSAYFKSDSVEMVVSRATEDFSLLGADYNVPYAYWNFGGSPYNPEEGVPYNHSPFFGPAIQPTLQAGTDAMALAVLAFLSISDG